jgi:hypothetical protein
MGRGWEKWSWAGSSGATENFDGGECQMVSQPGSEFKPYRYSINGRMAAAREIRRSPTRRRAASGRGSTRSAVSRCMPSGRRTGASN